MSHNIEYDDVRFDANRREVEVRINYHVEAATRMEGGHGLNSPIRWLDSVAVQPDRKAAEQKIKELDKGWYDSLAVRYYASTGITVTPKLSELEYKSATAYKKFKEADAKFHFVNAKSKFISCPCCGSKLSVEYLGKPNGSKNRCPLCRTDLRPQSTLDRIEALKKAWQQADRKAIAEEDALERKSMEVRWLIKYEYHT